MPTSTTVYKLSSGDEVLIEVESADSDLAREATGGHGVERVGATEKLAQAASRTLALALESACGAAEEALTALRRLKTTAQQVEVTFGIKLTATGNAIVTKGEAEANFAFKLLWKQPEGQGR